MGSKNAVRISIGTRSGRRSAVWRIWFGPKDIYAGFRTLAGIRKASIHFPRENQPNTLRYIGFTKDYAEKMEGGYVSREERTHLEWPGLELAPDYYLEYRFRIPESELRKFDENNIEDVLWLSAPPENMAAEVTIISGPETHTGQPPQRDDGVSNCIGEYKLGNGRFVWILHHNIVCPPNAVLQSHRNAVKEKLDSEGQHISSSPDLRVCLLINCEDGSAADVELSADFLSNVPSDA